MCLSNGTINPGSPLGRQAAASAAVATPAAPTTPARRTKRRRSILGLAGDSEDTLGMPGVTPSAKPTYGA